MHIHTDTLNICMYIYVCECTYILHLFMFLRFMHYHVFFHVFWALHYSPFPGLILFLFAVDIFAFYSIGSCDFFTSLQFVLTPLSAATCHCWPTPPLSSEMHFIIFVLILLSCSAFFNFSCCCCLFCGVSTIFIY